MVPRSCYRYGGLADLLTMHSRFDGMDLLPPLSELNAPPIEGQRVVAVAGRFPRTGIAVIIYAHASGLFLPVEARSHTADGHWTIRYSHWNEPVQPSIPAGAIPIGRTNLL